MDVPTYPKPLVVTDAAINIFPDLETKADIVQNAIDMAHAFGRELVKEGRIGFWRWVRRHRDVGTTPAFHRRTSTSRPRSLIPRPRYFIKL